jgi:hypothetical protein
MPIFLQLKVLKFMHLIPKIEMLIKFLEINGKNLTEFCINRFRGNVDLINLALTKFCPNLEILTTIFKEDELETLKIILNSCKYLEIIKVWYGDEYLNGSSLRYPAGIDVVI